MTARTVQRRAAAPASPAGLPARAIYPARLQGHGWPATCMDRAEVNDLLGRRPFAPVPGGRHPQAHATGVSLLLDWLEDQQGETWQDRWLSSGADSAGRGAWRQVPLGWLREHGRAAQWVADAFFRVLRLAIAAGIIRPSLPWLVIADFRVGSFTSIMARHRDPAGFSRLEALCSADPDIPLRAARLAAYRAAMILAAKGGVIGDITAGDVLELLEVESAGRSASVGATHLFYRVLRGAGALGDDAPATLRELRTEGQRTPAELIDRYRIACRPVRDLLADYLRERQPALDYASLRALSYYLAGLFWSDLEAHHPGIASLHLPADVASAWKQRLRSITKTVTTVEGQRSTVTVPRVNYRECLTPVRAFYLDLACWAVEHPARWGPWVAPCPIGDEEINRSKDKRRRKSRMDARTRERLPVLPVLAGTAARHASDTSVLVQAARAAAPGASFTAAGQTLTRIAPSRSAPARVWVQDPAAGTRRDLAREEEYAFWSFAVIEVLRHTGIRVEELTELSHHSLVQYQLPGSGEIVPLLQIAPSKTDTERLLVVSPDLADVLSAIISRVRGASGAIPLVRAYDDRERTWLAPMPLLFQRRYGFEHRAMSSGLIRDLLTASLTRTGMTDPVTGGPLHFTPHDFRRMFITDAVLNGLPPHIAQVIAGHRDINVTMGYKAVYPDEAIQAHLAFLSRRRALRPTEEYRVPTDEEWQQFLGHFERRKVATGLCARAFGTPCIHEHSCLRCSLHWPDPAQRPRIAEIRDNLITRIAEAEREGWAGEIEGLKVSLAGADDKLAQIDRQSGRAPVDLGIPAVSAPRQPPAPARPI